MLGRQRVGAGDRQIDHGPENAAPTERALHTDLTTHQFDQLLVDRQPEAAPAVLARRRQIGLLEGIEETHDLLRAQAQTGILHGKTDPAARTVDGLQTRFQPDRAFLGEFDRIIEEIEQDLPETHAIAAQSLRNRRVDIDKQRQALFLRLQFSNRRDPGNQLVEIEGRRFELELAGFDLGEIEDVVDQILQVPAGAADFFQVVALLRRQPGFQRQVRHADHGIDRRPDFVAHVREEIPLGPTGTFRLRPRLGEMAAQGIDIHDQAADFRRFVTARQRQTAALIVGHPVQLVGHAFHRQDDPAKSRIDGGHDDRQQLQQQGRSDENQLLAIQADQLVLARLDQDFADLGPGIERRIHFATDHTGRRIKGIAPRVAARNAGQLPRRGANDHTEHRRVFQQPLGNIPGQHLVFDKTGGTGRTGHGIEQGLQAAVDILAHPIESHRTNDGNRTHPGQQRKTDHCQSTSKSDAASHKECHCFFATGSVTILARNPVRMRPVYRSTALVPAKRRQLLRARVRLERGPRQRARPDSPCDR